MGVWGLNKYIRENVRNNRFPVKIKDEIDQWKR